MIKIEKRSPLFADLEWLSRALSTDKEKIQMQFLYWQDGELYAADGCRIHRIQFSMDSMVEKQCYELIKTKEGHTLLPVELNGLKYPDIKSLAETMSQGCDKELTWSKAAGWAGIKDLDTQLALMAFDVFTQLGQPVNLGFLRDAIKGMPSLTCFINRKDKPIVLKDNDHFCMLMPIKFKEPESVQS